MRLKGFHRIAAALIGSLVILLPALAYGDDSNAPVVSVKYNRGATKIERIDEKVKCFSNRNWTFADVPDELRGLLFTCRPVGGLLDVNLDISAGATVYVIIDSDAGGRAKDKGVPELHQQLSTQGWTRLDDLKTGGRGDFPRSVYRQTFSTAQQVELTGGGSYGIAIASKQLVLDSSVAQEKPKAKPKPQSQGDDPPANPANTVFDDPVPASDPMAGPTAKIVNNQTTIKCLEILEVDNGMMLGKASDLTLTLHASADSKLTTVHFITQIGSEMSTERDDVLRYVQVTYPNWFAQPGELTFEDKYNAHDGGSNGAAVGLLMLSAIQGFDIDEDIAVTGELAPNGKIHAIGGVSSKIHGAIDAKCSLVAVPMENKDQLVDALIYSGPQTFLDIQVLGISNMQNAVATVRSDRDANMADAITEFSALQESQKHDSRYYLGREGQAHLEHILQLAPRDLSAQLLLDFGQNKLPRTLSAGASLYYTFLDADCMLPALESRKVALGDAAPPSASVHDGLRRLRKLRPIADPSVRPLIDAFDNFILAWDDLEQNQGSLDRVEARQKELQDALANLNADQALMQKMLSQGM